MKKFSYISQYHWIINQVYLAAWKDFNPVAGIPNPWTAQRRLAMEEYQWYTAYV